MTYPTSSLEEVWGLFKEARVEITQVQTEVAQVQLEVAKARTEIAELSKETDRRFRETDRQLKENALQIKETDRQVRENALQLKETDRQVRENALQLKETDRQIRNMSKKIGELGGRLGSFVEGLIRPSVVKLFQQRGIDVHKVNGRVEVDNPKLGLSIEIDLLVINQDTCILVEVKSHLSVDDVNQHLERMQKFKPLFPEYENRQVLGAVAGMVIPPTAAKYAYRKGLFVIGQRGDHAVILNDLKFKPAVW